MYLALSMSSCRSAVRVVWMFAIRHFLISSVSREEVLPSLARGTLA